MIKIIHQIAYIRYRGLFAKDIKTWKEHNPDWEFRLWTPEDCLKYAKYYNLDDVYLSYDNLTKKINLGRYLITHYWGGCFVDTDTRCLRSLNTLFDSDKVHLVTEPKHHHYYVMNGFYYTPKEHKFLQDIILGVAGRPDQHSTVLNGPGYINEILKDNDYDDVIIHEDDNELFVWSEIAFITDKTIVFHHNQSCR